MNEVEYQSNEFNCLTECPFSEKFKTSNEIERIRKVGSIGCHECVYFVNDNKNKKIVTCKYSKK